MHFHILTLFPEMVLNGLGTSITAVSYTHLKEFVRYLLEDGADSKALFWSEIPGLQLPGENK